MLNQIFRQVMSIILLYFLGSLQLNLKRSNVPTLQYEYRQREDNVDCLALKEYVTIFHRVVFEYAELSNICLIKYTFVITDCN